MTESQGDRIQSAFSELRATDSSRTPAFGTIRDRPTRRRRVRPATLPIAAAAMLVTFLVARGARSDEAPSITTWRAPSDDLIQETATLTQLTAGSAALNELLPATLQIGGGQ